MSLYDGFDEMDFAKQIEIIREIENEKSFEAIPFLIRLFSTENHNDMVIYMVENALLSIFNDNSSAVFDGLKSMESRVRKMAIQVCGEKRMESAVQELTNMLKFEKELEFRIFTALSEIKSPETFHIFKDNIFNEDSMISNLSLKMMKYYNNESSIKDLIKMVETVESEAEDKFQSCDTKLIASIEGLGAFKNHESLTFLLSKIFFKNPTAKRLIRKEILKAGEDIIPYLVPLIETGDIDYKVFSVFSLGFMGGGKAGKALIDAIDNGLLDSDTIKFATFEALGTISHPKGVLCLTDNLVEENEYLLSAVITSLEKQMNKGVFDKLYGLINLGNEHSSRLLKTIIYTMSGGIFKELCTDEIIAEKLIAEINFSKNSDIKKFFSRELEKIEIEKSFEGNKRIKYSKGNDKRKKLLAIDNMDSILSVYKLIASDLDMEIVTAENGRMALQISRENSIDLVLSDLNMPVLDGIEFTSEFRSISKNKEIPVFIITSEKDKLFKDYAKKTGVTDIVKKPFRLEYIKKKIMEYL